MEDTNTIGTADIFVLRPLEVMEDTNTSRAAK